MAGKKKASSPKPKKEPKKSSSPKKDYSDKMASDYENHPKFSKFKGDK